MRLTNTCVSRVASPCSSSASGHVDLERLAALAQQRLDQRRARRRPRRASSMLWRRTSSWPDSMRTLSSRLSMRRVRRSVPRSSDSTSSSSFSGGLVFSPSRSSSMEASCAASGVRNSWMTFASTVSRARRTPSSSVSSRITCTCRPLTMRELVITVWRLPELVCSCSTDCALPAWRARRMGQAVVAQGRVPLAIPGPQGLSTSPQNLPMASAGFDA